MAVDPVVPLTRPWLDAAEADAMAAVLRSGALVQGERVAAFEAQVAARCQRKHGIATANGTAALQLALAALGIGRDDEVICPDLSWPSPAHAIVTAGARPVLVDVEAGSWNLDPSLLPQARSSRCRAAIVIDQLGNPADRPAIVGALGDLPIIEDAACALGSHFADRPCGSLGAIACLSFHPRKILTTGEGGMCLTDDDALADALRILRNHGQRSPGTFVQAAGNHRLTEFAAAMGLVQLAKLDAQIEARQVAMQRYREELGGHLQFQRTPSACRSNQQTCGVLLPVGTPAGARDALLQALLARGVQASRLSYAMHSLPSLHPHARLVSSANGPWHSSDIADRGLALPLFHGLTEALQTRVIEAVLACLPSDAPGLGA